MKTFKSKEDFFNRANDKLKKFIKDYCTKNIDENLDELYLSSALVECGFRYIHIPNSVLIDIVLHYRNTL